jgi:D-serine deaminase-like pyridoxal phosphate-dependent protein
MTHHPSISETGLGSWKNAPAVIGAAVAAIDTPALLIDLDAMERNIEEVHSAIQTAGIAVRSHAKAHKCPDIALRQVKAGAVGICVQKASEAEPFIDVGIKNILITNEVVGVRKVERVARLAALTHMGLCVDNIVQVHQIGAAARRHHVAIDVYIEMDVGHGRCGVTSADAAIEIAEAIATYSPALVFAGLQAYHGTAQHMREPEQRIQAIQKACSRVKEMIAALGAAGFAVNAVTGGGTGTYELEAESGVYTEVQPGSYVLMDNDYQKNTPDNDMPILKNALYALCTVMSVSPTHAVLDAGLKAFAVDSGLPKITTPGWTVQSISDEHTTIVSENGATALKVGDKVKLIPGHCDPTVNLHDWLIAVRNDKVEELWPVSARGALF